MFYFMQLLDVQISLLSTRLQWPEKGRPMVVQYGTWTDRPNKDVLWTSLGRAMAIGERDGGMPPFSFYGQLPDY